MRLLRDTIGVAAIALLLSVIVAGVTVDVQDLLAKRDCFVAAGRVEHYDADRPQVWRCIGARPEAQ